MALWNQASYFEKRNADYVYRASIFAQGFSISEREKDLLSRDLRRLERRFLIEGGFLIVLIAGIFMTGVIQTGAPIAWFMFCSVLGVTLLAVSVVYRRDRAARRVLGHRRPDVERQPFKQAIVTPKPSISRRHAIMILQSTIALFALALAVGDALVFYVISIANRSLGTEGSVTLGMGHAGLWVAAAVWNVVLVAGMVFAMRQVRRLRAASDRPRHATGTR